MILFGPSWFLLFFFVFKNDLALADLINAFDIP